MTNCPNKLIILLFVLHIVTYTNLSQVSGYSAFGNFSFYQSNSYNFNALPGVPRPNVPLSNSSNSQFECGLYSTVFFYNKFYFEPRISFLKNKINFLDFEKTLVGINGEPVDAKIKHNLLMEFSYIDLSLLLGIKLFDGINVSIGNRFLLNVASNFNQTQTLIEPQNVDFIKPTANHAGKINGASSIHINPVMNFSFDLVFSSSKSFILKPEISFAYFPESLINNLPDNKYFRSFSANIGLSLEYKKYKPKTINILYDTIVYRDTVTVYSTETRTQSIVLNNSSVKQDSSLGDGYIKYSIYKYESFANIIPKAKPFLNGELKTVFVSGNGQFFSEYESSLVKTIYTFNYFKFDSLKSKYEKKKSTLLDTSLIASIPIVRFYPKAVSDDGLAEWSLEIVSNNKLIKVFKGNNEFPPDSLDFVISEELKTTDIIGKSFRYDYKIKDVQSQEKHIASGVFYLNENPDNSEYFGKKTIFVIQPETNYRSLLKLARKTSANKRISAISTMNKLANKNLFDEIEKEFSINISSDKQKKEEYKQFSLSESILLIIE